MLLIFNALMGSALKITDFFLLRSIISSNKGINNLSSYLIPF